METYEQGFVRALLRNTHETLQFGNFKEVAQRLKAAHSPVDHDEAVKYVRGQTASLKHAVLMHAAIRLFIENRSAIMTLLRERGDHAAASYLASIMRRVSKPGEARERPGVADVIFNNWRHPFSHPGRNMPNGVYQMFRRYKPRANEILEGDRPDSSLTWDGDHDIIVCELLYIDGDAMECVLVTSEGSVYWGSLYINHNMTLYALLQRPNSRGSDQNGVSQRIYAINIRPSGGAKLSVFSGLYIKSGDITERPLSGESVIVAVPNEGHEELWAGMYDLFVSEWSEIEVPLDSCVMEYISGFEEDGEAQVSRISDFPLLNNIAEPNENDLILFREPSRALDSLVLMRRSKQHPLPIFRRPTSTRVA